ncbi:HlyD family secretion protein [Schlesneria paludicola]|uniref:HlyD family secretion protein n=1 Tax=Schlesneria paludicola TaxID=360056 RepID=UPI00049282A2|nr:HlyD family secretion protein [Schlesneria paludicola]
MNLRFGGTQWLNYPVRIAVALGGVAAGCLPYNFEICGHCHIVPRSEAGLRSQLTDEIAMVYVGDGDLVDAGSVVARLVGRDVDADFAKARADVEYATAFLKQMQSGYRPEDIAAAVSKLESVTSQLSYAEQQVDRNSNLLGKSAVAQSAYEKSISSRDSLKSEMAAVKENVSKLQAGYRQEEIDEAKAKLAKAEAELQLQTKKNALKEIKSPIRGTICKPAIEAIAGHTVVPGDLIAVVQDREQLLVQVMADEAAAYHVKKGMPVKIRLWGNYGGLITGRVERIVATAVDEGKLATEGFRTDRESTLMQQRYPDSHWRYIQVMVKLDENAARESLMPGMTGEARIVVAEDSFWGALTRDLGRLVLVEVWSWLP